MPEADTTKIKVAVRIRPLSERAKKDRVVITIQPENNSIHVAQEKKSRRRTTYYYDHVYGQRSENATVYNDIGRPILDAALEGYNGTIFAYGQTGSGKTFTMMGEDRAPGIIPQLNAELFSKIDASSHAFEFLVQVSFLEIYMEKVSDLINPSEENLRIREHPKLGVYVDGLMKIVAKTPGELSSVMIQGNKMRQVAETRMNDRSSRSHTVFTIFIQKRDKGAKERIRKAMEEGRELPRQTGCVAKINLVDLAGSERQKDTGTTGKNLREAAAINTSLSALGNVINALSDPKKRKKHIPYRDSALTRILQESLGGNSKTIMIATIRPAHSFLDESTSTLKYASRAKQITNISKRNEDENDKTIRELREEVERLRRELQDRKGQPEADATETRTEKEKLQDLMYALEQARMQNWDDAEKQSERADRVRLAALQKQNLYDLVLSSIKEEQSKAARRLEELKRLHEEMVAQYGEMRREIEKKRQLVEQCVNHLRARVQKFIEEGKRDLANEPTRDPQCRSFMERMSRLQAAIQRRSEEMAALRERITANKEMMRTTRSEAMASNAFLKSDTQLRDQIQKDERARIEEENAHIIVEEKKRLVDEFRVAISKMETKAEGPSVEEYVQTKLDLLDERSRNTALETRIRRLEADCKALAERNALLKEYVEKVRQNEEEEEAVRQSFRDALRQKLVEQRVYYEKKMEAMSKENLRMRSRIIFLEARVGDGKLLPSGGRSTFTPSTGSTGSYRNEPSLK